MTLYKPESIARQTSESAQSDTHTPDPNHGALSIYTTFFIGELVYFCGNSLDHRDVSVRSLLGSAVLVRELTPDGIVKTDRMPSPRPDEDRARWRDMPDDEVRAEIAERKRVFNQRFTPTVATLAEIGLDGFGLELDDGSLLHTATFDEQGKLPTHRVLPVISTTNAARPLVPIGARR